ncbi:MAG: hypothetical protein U0787_09285 [Polyangia bacterium]|jgi:hypothetical protein
MKRSLAIDNHVAFQWSVVRSVVAGGLLGLVHTGMAASNSTLSLMSSLTGTWSWLYGALSVALLGAAAVPARSQRQAVWLVGSSALAAAVTLVRAQTGETVAGPAIFAWSLILALYLAQGTSSRWQSFVTIVVGSLLGIAAQLLPDTMEGQGLLLSQPLWIANGVAGGCVGLLVGVSTVGRHLVLKTAPVEGELRALLPPADSDDELAKLVRQALLTYEEAVASLEEHEAAKAAASQLASKIGRFGKRWQDIETQAKKSNREQLTARKNELRNRIDSSSDESIRLEYTRALAAIDEQLSYLDDIAKGRERAIARLHHQVATLERLRLAAVRHHSVGAAKLGEELKSVVEELNQAGQDLDTAVEVLAELPN